MIMDKDKILFARLEKFATDYKLGFDWHHYLKFDTDKRMFILRFWDPYRDLMYEYRISWDEIMHHTSIDALYDNITSRVIKEFGLVVAPVDEVKYDAGVGVVCGLSKNEYIALELTKAWASLPHLGGINTRADVMNTYTNFLKDLEEGK